MIAARSLGSSGIKVVPLAFGGNVFGWTANRERSFALLDAFVDLGFNLVDTADIYSTWVPGHEGGESETIIGEWFKATGNRDRVVIATKVGMEMGDGAKGLRKENIVRAVEKSLCRLQTDVIDLYQAHEDDASVPLEETLSAFDSLIRAGKVRAIGASNYSAARLTEALDASREAGLASYVSLQPEYNLYDRAEFEKELELLCVERNIGVISYYSLASGFLTGKYRTDADLDQSVRGGGIAKYLNPRGFAILAALDDIAAGRDVTPAAVALAWLMQRPAITAPIASATSVEQLEALAEAAALTLTDEEVSRLDSASAY